MRRTKFAAANPVRTAWGLSVDLLRTFLQSGGKASEHLEAATAFLPEADRAACRALFLSALRQAHRTRRALDGLVSKPPGVLVEAILLTAGAELVAAPAEKRPKVVHHAVEQAGTRVSRAEAGFVNAVLRKLAGRIHAFDPETEPAAYFSHPEWLVRRWNGNFGPANTRALLEWNQGTPRTYLRVGGEMAPAQLRSFGKTPWPGFYEVPPGISWDASVRPLLRSGAAYIKDPSTRFAAELLDPRLGERVLDLCAAPGGKTRDCARAMGGSGSIVAVDLPGPRMARLKENLARIPSPAPRVEVVGADVAGLEPDRLAGAGHPAAYDAVLLDAPCSNTGVIRRRTDVKLRLGPESMAEAARLQQRLIRAAASFVADGGRLVYSTCSIEPEENRAVVEDFLAADAGRRFALKRAVESFPWESGHDGAGAFLLVRRP
jgi:16S rRNA (cytosine967-C5)-methyltransferase